LKTSPPPTIPSSAPSQTTLESGVRGHTAARSGSRRTRGKQFTKSKTPQTPSTTSSFGQPLPPPLVPSHPTAPWRLMTPGASTLYLPGCPRPGPGFPAFFLHPLHSAAGLPVPRPVPGFASFTATWVLLS
jgi:hypothetical protein